ncbi:MAG: neutral zinc metallopeptidase [Actinomycetes bacterium]
MSAESSTSHIGDDRGHSGDDRGSEAAWGTGAPWWAQRTDVPTAPPVATGRPQLGGVAPDPASDVWQSPTVPPLPVRSASWWTARRTVAAVGWVVIAALLAGSAAWGWGEVQAALSRAGQAQGVPLVPAQRDAAEPVPASASEIVVRNGDPNDPAQRVVVAALRDVDSFWKRTYRRIDAQPYRSISGGFYAFGNGETPPCTDDPQQVAGNAYYCAEADVIAWDQQRLIPRLRARYGDLGIGLVIAHEWGHAVQIRAGVVDEPTIFMEQQADCYAGAWVADARRRNGFFEVTDASLDRAMTGFLELRDPVGMTTAATPGAHGTAFDRIRAFQEGVQGGATRCSAYRVDALPLVGINFQSYDDYATQGNLPLADALDLTTKDLADFWGSQVEALGGDAGVSQPNVRLTDTPATCARSVQLAARVRYCPSTNEITVSQKNATSAHDQIGDFAVSALVGIGWGAAVLSNSDRLPTGARARQDASTCLAGAWTRSVFAADRTGAQLSLSPGDLDEAVTALMVMRSGRTDADRARGTDWGTGFERVAAYRRGFTDGLSACVR